MRTRKILRYHCSLVCLNRSPSVGKSLEILAEHELATQCYTALDVWSRLVGHSCSYSVARRKEKVYQNNVINEPKHRK